jgi:hypothetical protein
VPQGFRVDIAGQIYFFDGTRRIREVGVSFLPAFLEVQMRTVAMLITLLGARYPC